MAAPINHLSLPHPRRLLSDGIEITCVSFDGPNVSVGKGSNVPSCAPFRGEGRVSSYLYKSQRSSTMKNIKTPKYPLSHHQHSCSHTDTMAPLYADANITQLQRDADDCLLTYGTAFHPEIITSTDGINVVTASGHRMMDVSGMQRKTILVSQR